jgi:biotin-(acetyl-CoA carboxylase) ligase
MAKWSDCRILAEAVASDAAPVSSVVLGYGINVGPMAYPQDLAKYATSLESELGRDIDRASVCVETLVSLGRRYNELLDGRFDAILDAWLARAPASRGARVTWQTPTGAATGVTMGIDDSGALLVRVGSRIERLVAGEVNWV